MRNETEDRLVQTFVRAFEDWSGEAEAASLEEKTGPETETLLDQSHHYITVDETYGSVDDILMLGCL